MNKSIGIIFGIIILLLGTWFSATFSDNSQLPSEYEVRGCDGGSWCK